MSPVTRCPARRYLQHSVCCRRSTSGSDPHRSRSASQLSSPTRRHWPHHWDIFLWYILRLFRFFLVCVLVGVPGEDEDLSGDHHRHLHHRHAHHHHHYISGWADPPSRLSSYSSACLIVWGGHTSRELSHANSNQLLFSVCWAIFSYTGTMNQQQITSWYQRTQLIPALGSNFFITAWVFPLWVCITVHDDFTDPEPRNFSR